MFWRFGGYSNVSAIDTLLEKTDVTLEELLDESDLIQEVKQHNSKLIEFLRETDALDRLLAYVVATDAEDDTKRTRYAYVATEVLSADTWSICEALMEHEDLIRRFWTFVERPAPLDALQASYFTKINETLLDKKTWEMLELFKSIPDIVGNLLKHVDSPMIMDLLLKIISLEKADGGQGIIEWLYGQDLMPTLLSFLSPEHSWSTQTSAGDFLKAIITISANASQNEQSCIGPNDLTRQLVSQPCVERLIGDMLHGGNPLTVGVGIVIEVIRKNNSDYDPDGQTHAPPTSRDPIYLGTLLRLFAAHVPDFMALILGGGEKELQAAFGEKIEPLGFDRFKTCELMAELLHCSNMGLLNELGSEEFISRRDQERERLRGDFPDDDFEEVHVVSDEVVGDYLKTQFVEHKVVPTILDFFFRFPWNNFLHNVVYDVVQQVFNGPMDRGFNRSLAIDVFAEGDITNRIVQGQKRSDDTNKMRLGYMGHLTLIAEEVVKFTERHPPELLSETVLDKINADWVQYVEVTLAETRERDNAILGGVRPDQREAVDAFTLEEESAEVRLLLDC